MTDRELLMEMLRRADIPFLTEHPHGCLGEHIVIQNDDVERHRFAVGSEGKPWQPEEAWPGMFVVFQFSAGRLVHAYATE